MTFATDGDVTSILAGFGGDPQRAEGLAEFLGFEPIPNPEDRLAGALSGGLRQFLRGRGDRGFGVSEFYRVGTRDATPAEAGLWIGVLSDWGYRSSDRDRSRRRITRALVEHVPDMRALALLVPPRSDPRQEAELVFPRTHVGESGGVTSIRAHLDLDSPNRFHRDLLRGLRIPQGANLLEVSRTWQQEFSVERVTTKFYQEYTSVRDRMVKALLEQNRDHPVVQSFSEDDARAWSTRQMGRVLFLWFLQAKRWLGEPGGHGSPTYLLDLWSRRTETEEGEYYRGILAPMFFDAMATGSSSHGEDSVLGFVPYLNGGLFRRSVMEDRINDAGEVSLPDEVFDPEDDSSLLGLLSRYRFTTRESTPDDQSVDPDPELLGRVFENLYQGDERRKTGTYYTPREVVHFMCREVLDGYLRDNAGVEQGTLNILREEAVGSRDEHQPIPGVPTDALIDALETVRICDPAVGSGAFLLGAIQEMVTLRRGILFSQRGYIEPDDLYQAVSEWKRRIIENSLYGVDINPEAVEICRLRLWLSMVLDMEEPPAANSDWALPNLDFQIVAGDSLVDRVTGVTLVGTWPPQVMTMELDLRRRIEQLVSNILSRRREFERTQRDPRRLRELRDLIARDQRKIVELHLQDALDKAKADLTALKRSPKPTKTALNRANKQIARLTAILDDMAERDFVLVQKPFLWPIAFPEILSDGDAHTGFDIVLANPPYVRQERLDPEDQQAYGQAFPDVHTGTADALVYFYARALQILRPNGWMAFITSNKFMRARYGEGLREHLPASLRIQRVIDFNYLPLFEASGKPIAAYPSVLVGRRNDDAGEEALSVADLTNPIRKELSDANLKLNAENVRGVLEDLYGLLQKSETRDFPQVLLAKSRWLLEDPVLVRLFERLMNQGDPLGDYVKGRLYRGVVTGRNEAFVIDHDKRADLIEEDPGSAELIKPWLRGRDIKRWKAEFGRQHVIAVPNSGDAGARNLWGNANSEEEARDIFKNTYPAIHDHLSFHESKLRPRSDQGRFWWELRACTYYHEFARPKIVFNRFADSPTFAYDTTGAYHNDACYFTIPPTPSLAAVVNSPVGWWLLLHLCTFLQNGYIQLFVQFLEQLPVPPISPGIDRRLAEYVEVLAAGEDDPEIERDIDSIVFEAYGLSALERKLVLDSLGERSEALGHDLSPDWRKLNSLRATAGAWKGKIDADELIEDIYASRLISTRPEPKL